MLQKKTMRITAKYRIPEVKKYKNGWRIVFWYQKNGELKRHILRCEKYKKSFERAKDAELWISENLCVPLTQELQNGWTPEQGMPNFCNKSNNDIRLSVLADLFLEDAYERYKAKLINYTSYSCYKSFCKVISSSTSFGIEDCNIHEITRVKAEKFIVQIKALREWQAKTTNNFIKLCRMLFKFAVDNSLASVNPFEKVALIKGEQKSKRTLSKEEQTKIYDYLHATNVPFLVYTQLVYTDLIRPVEIFRIQCKDLDPVNRKITLRAGKTKNKKERVLLIPQSLEALFDQYLQEIDYVNANKEAYLFSEDFRPKVSKDPLPSAYASIRWRKMCQELNLPDDCKLYGLRHTGICDLLTVLPMNTVRMLADHSDTKQTIHYANHENEQIRKEVAAKAPIFGVYCD